jgi:hypothetical protein
MKPRSEYYDGKMTWYQQNLIQLCLEILNNANNLIVCAYVCVSVCVWSSYECAPEITRDSVSLEHFCRVAPPKHNKNKQTKLSVVWRDLLERSSSGLTHLRRRAPVAAMDSRALDPD